MQIPPMVWKTLRAGGGTRGIVVPFQNSRDSVIKGDVF
jgi:hypothetical protein